MRAKLPTTLISPFSHPHPSPSPSLTIPTHPHLLPPIHQHIRPLTHTSPLHKKSSKHAIPLPFSETQNPDPSNRPNDPDSALAIVPDTRCPPKAVGTYDFADYNDAIQKAHERLKAELARIKAGGRSADDIEGLRVVLKGDGGGSGGSKGKGRGEKGREERDLKGGGRVRLGDVASVVVRGRNVGVLVGEKEHLKPILSSLATLPSLTPTSSPTDPLTLTIAIPPITAESRLAAKKQADKKGEEAQFALREARGAQKKRNRSNFFKRVVGPDEMRKVEREMESMNAGAVGEAKGLVQGCKKGLEGG